MFNPLIFRLVMNIFTSNFAKAKSLDSSKFLVVAISRYVPKGYSGVRELRFAPSRKLLMSYKNGLSTHDYEEIFFSELGNTDSVYSVFCDLAKLSNGRDIVLCCYEKAGEFCHRRLIADFVFSHWHYDIKELFS